MKTTEAKALPKRTAAAGVTTEQASNKKIDTLLKSASSHLVNFRETVQECAVTLIEHANAFGDCSRAKVLCRVVPARERNSLIGWFALYSPIGVAMGKTAADDKCRFIRDTSNSYNDFNIDGAKANPWYSDPSRSNPEPKPLNTLIDFYNDLDGLLKRMVNQAEADDEKNRWQPEDRAALRKQATEIRNIVGKYRATHLTPDGHSAANNNVAKPKEKEVVAA